MKTYTFRIVVEPDGERWHAYCPALVGEGGSTGKYGCTPEQLKAAVKKVGVMGKDVEKELKGK